MRSIGRGGGRGGGGGGASADPEQAKALLNAAVEGAKPVAASGAVLFAATCIAVCVGMVGCALLFAWLCSVIVITDVNDAPPYTRSFLFLSTAHLLDAFQDIAYPPPPPPAF